MYCPATDLLPGGHPLVLNRMSHQICRAALCRIQWDSITDCNKFIVDFFVASGHFMSRRSRPV